MLRFFCFQPLLMSEELFTKHHFSNFTIGETWSDITFNNHKDSDANLDLDWHQEISKFFKGKGAFLSSDHKEYNSKLDEINNSELIKNFEFDKSESGFVLYYDKDVDIFFIVTCLALNKTNQYDMKCLERINHQIRNEFVIDDINGNLEVSSWYESIKEHCIKAVARELNIITQINQKIYIRNNTGYIFSILPKFEEYCSTTYQYDLHLQDFLSSNFDIDQVKEKKDIYSNFSIACNDELINSTTNLNTPKIVFFGWRCSTIYGIKDNKDLHILPVLIKLQNIYIIINDFYKTFITKLFHDVKYNEEYRKLSDTLVVFDKFVVFFENLKFEKDNFIVHLKPYQTEVFKEVENYWSLNSDYNSIDKTLNICQTSLHRKLELKNNKVQQKQSDILFVLAIVQIFSIISILSDYFGFITITTDPDDIKNHVQGIYNVSNNYLLYSLFTLSLILILFAYYERVTGFFKGLKRFF
ncbi:hypothetical protein JCM30760_21350 [Thiomicrorhabdus hydrogeniphila]